MGSYFDDKNNDSFDSYNNSYNHSDNSNDQNNSNSGSSDNNSSNYGNNYGGNSGSDSSSYGSSGYGNYNSNNYSGYSNNNYQNNNQYSQYGGNIQYKWNYDDYQKALNQNKNKKLKKKKGGLKPFLITVCTVFGVAILGLAIVGATTLAKGGNVLGTTSSAATGNSNATKLNIESQPTTSSPSTAGRELTTEEVAEKLTPSVVGIEIYDLSSVEPIAEGTGIIMSSDGYIITNAHVISGAQKICVVLSDGTKYDTVKTIGSDTKSDLAVLKINATGLTAATFGDSDQLKVGQAVVAIGNPGGLTFANTVTNGIVSGLNRTVTSASGSQMTYIQTNALINPGNSGGPLVNMYGQVVGINTAKITETGYEGIGFSIPINTAKPYIDSIIQYGYVKGRVKVGISVYSLSNSQARWYNYPSGLYVESIERDSDAYAKGLRTKDIITEINGISLANDDSSEVYNTFYKEESKHKAGDTITIKVYRTETGRTLTFKIKLVEDKGDREDPSSEGGQSNENGSGDGSDFWSQFGR